MAAALALDAAGNVYVTGITTSADFPGVDADSADNTFGGHDAFVAKLDDQLNTLLAATFLGGSAGGGSCADSASALALDAAGHVYVAGITFCSDFPGVDGGSADSIFAGGEGFVAKLDPSLSTIVAATFLGGGNDGCDSDAINSLTLDATGAVYVAGDTFCSDFPGVDGGSADSTFAGNREGFVGRLDANLSVLLGATFLGGSRSEQIRALARDATGAVYVAGHTSSADFPGVDAGSADSTFTGEHEAFVAKLDPALSTVLAATFLGGSGLANPTHFDRAHALALDAAGNVYVAGETDSADFPGVTAGSADSTFAGESEAFVAKLDPSLSALLAATFLGGSASSPVNVQEPVRALALDGAGNVYVAGGTPS
ncbi:MAG: SBBP repeat-containing protein, partial [Candidatus Binatia bacterium]